MSGSGEEMAGFSLASAGPRFFSLSILISADMIFLIMFLPRYCCRHDAMSQQAASSAQLCCLNPGHPLKSQAMPLVVDHIYLWGTCRFHCLSLQKTEGSHPASLFNSSNCTKVTGKSAQIEPGKTGPQKETLIICSRRQKQSLFSPCLSLGNVLCVWICWKLLGVHWVMHFLLLLREAILNKLYKIFNQHIVF